MLILPMKTTVIWMSPIRRRSSSVKGQDLTLSGHERGEKPSYPAITSNMKLNHQAKQIGIRALAWTKDPN